MCFASAHAGTRRRRFVLILACSALALLAGQVPEAQAQGFRVVPLVRDEQVLISFDLRDGFTDDIRAAIKSGLKTTYTYAVDLRMDVPGWVDRTIGSTVVTISVEYDNLKRRYDIVQMVDGRSIASKQTDNEAEVRQWMTSMVRQPLFRTHLLEPNREYYVRVAASARPTNGSMLWPFGSGTSATAKFTFLR